MISLFKKLQGLLAYEQSHLTTQAISKIDVTIRRQYHAQQISLLRTDYLE